MTEGAIVLVSGGMDSLVAAAISLREYKPYFLHIRYGQRTEQRELKAFIDIADYYKVEDRMVIELTHFKKIGGSSLTDTDMQVPESLSKTGIPNTYVPFRNANLLSIAVSWAEVIGVKKIFIGATDEDSAGYPDCRKTFYQAYNQLIREGTRSGDIVIETPIIDMNKIRIIKLGTELNAPFSLTWSCYQNEDLACGKCDSCRRRLKAFKEAGVEDPLIYMDI
ncbi:MAG: 7-cyano-7-deazaguanine synthase QueC [Spirochaetes bacterium]|nr:7-cyano-7-deazaguanine synthase QueC [Spirochaetota bacterium]